MQTLKQAARDFWLTSRRNYEREEMIIRTETSMKYIENNFKRIILSMTAAVIVSLPFASCDGRDNKSSSAYVGEDSSDMDEYPVGCFKRVSVAKEGETYEKMLELRDIASRGYLVVNDDFTAYFDLDGERTEYTYDKKNFYVNENGEPATAFSYVQIGSRLVTNDGTTVMQFLMLTDDELAYYLEHGSETVTDTQNAP
jgi:hypothetical protein